MLLHKKSNFVRGSYERYSNGPWIVTNWTQKFQNLSFRLSCANMTKNSRGRVLNGQWEIHNHHSIRYTWPVDLLVWLCFELPIPNQVKKLKKFKNPYGQQETRIIHIVSFQDDCQCNSQMIYLNIFAHVVLIDPVCENIY